MVFHCGPGRSADSNMGTFFQSRGVRLGSLLAQPGRVLTLCLLTVIAFQAAGQWLTPPPEASPGWWVGRLDSIPFASGNAHFVPIRRIVDHQSPDLSRHCSGSAYDWRIQLSGLKRALGKQAFLPGACVLLRLEQRRPHQLMSSGLWSQRQRIAAHLRISDPVRYLDAHSDAVQSTRLRLRGVFEEFMQSPGGRLSAPIALGLVTGDRALMKPWMWEVFSRTGTSHLMSISGSHVTSLAFLAYCLALFLLKRIPAITRRIPAQQLALLVSMLAAASYGMMAGMNVPTQRTLAMMAAGCAAKWRGGSLLSWETLGAAALAVLAVDPLAIIDVGAWLSFSAVAIIMLVTGGHLRPRPKIHAWIAIQCGLFVGLAPVSAAVFGGYSLLGPVANAVAIPVVGLLVAPMSLLVALTSVMVPVAGAWLFFPVDLLVTTLFAFLQWLAAWDWAMLRLPPLDPVVAILSLVGVVVVVMSSAVPFRTASAVFLFPSMMGPGFGGITQYVYLSEARKWDVLIESDSGLTRVQQASGAGSEKSMQSWAYRAGYVLSGEAAANTWVSSGFVVTTYSKVAGLPGQRMLVPRDIHFPCVDGRIGQTFTGLRISEQECWLMVDWGRERWLFADGLGRDRQLRAAGLPWNADRLAVSPSAGERLLGATVSREGLRGVVFSPGTSGSYHAQEDMLAVRSLVSGGWASTGLFECANPLGGWQRCTRGSTETDQKN
jgi:ComEC/Rec2-related protein